MIAKWWAFKINVTGKEHKDMIKTKDYIQERGKRLKKRGREGREWEKERLGCKVCSRNLQYIKVNRRKYLWISSFLEPARPPLLFTELATVMRQCPPCCQGFALISPLGANFSWFLVSIYVFFRDTGLELVNTWIKGRGPLKPTFFVSLTYICSLSIFHTWSCGQLAWSLFHRPGF